MLIVKGVPTNILTSIPILYPCVVDGAVDVNEATTGSGFITKSISMVSLLQGGIPLT